MKVLNLSCDAGHVFEGWFASESDFQNQVASQMVQCPVCSCAQVHKMPSAPRLNLGVSRGDETSPAPTAESPSQSEMPELQQMQAQMMRAMREIVSKTEDVGERFAQEARKIHHGESDPRNIRGQATPEQTHELLEEGIAVMPLMLPEFLKNPTH